MEQLLHYVWKHKIFPLRGLTTTNGLDVEVINPGLQNHDAGPDFFNAKVKINGVLWSGNVEIHTKASDWYRHHHDTDVNYDNIILHVVGKNDCQVKTTQGKDIMQVVIEVPEYVEKNYDKLNQSDCWPKCANIINNIPAFSINNWMASLYLKRLERQTTQIMNRWNSYGKDWEKTLFVTIARNFGFGKNGDAFEQWAQTIPFSAVGKHRDNLLQVEAIFFGQAGFLDDDSANDKEYSEYFYSLKREYKFLQNKFSNTTPLQPIDKNLWKFLRMRPQNFPYIKIALLAKLYHENKINMSKLLEFGKNTAYDSIDPLILTRGENYCLTNIKDLENMFKTPVSEFWQTHYTFNGNESEKNNKFLSKESINLLIINSVCPILFAYGRYKNEDTFTGCVYDIMQQIKPEKNKIINDWEKIGVMPKNATESQAIIELNNEYCLKSKCLQCKFGFEFIRNTPDFLKEENEL